MKEGPRRGAPTVAMGPATSPWYVTGEVGWGHQVILLSPTYWPVLGAQYARGVVDPWTVRLPVGGLRVPICCCVEVAT
jgi:hypothetical protein